MFSSFISQGVMLLAWLYLPWTLSVEEIGQFALLSFIIELFSRLTAMGMDSALLRFYVDASRRSRVFASAVGWLAVGGSLATFALVLTWNIVPNVFGGLSPVYHQLAWLVLAVALTSALSNAVLVHYVASNDSGRFGWLNTLRSLLLAGGYVLGASSGLGLSGLLLSQLASSLGVILFFWFSRPFPLQPLRPESKAMRELVVYGSPMLFYSLFALISDYSGRLALESQVALSAMGVFQFYYQITTQVNGVWNSINRAWTPFVFQRMESDQPAAYAIITRFSLWGTLVCAAGIIVIMLLNLAGAWSLLIPPDYLAHIELFYLLLLGPLYCCIYTAIYPAFYFSKNTLKISFTQSVMSLLTIFLTIFFTIRYQSEGAALSWPLGIFLTPIIYISLFPALRARLAPSLTILLIWGATGGMMAFALLQWHSTLWAAMALLLGIAGVVFFGGWALAIKPASAA